MPNLRGASPVGRDGEGAVCKRHGRATDKNRVDVTWFRRWSLMLRRRSDEEERASVERRRATGMRFPRGRGTLVAGDRDEGCQATRATVGAQRKRRFKLLMSPLTGNNLLPNQQPWAAVQVRGVEREQGGDS